jgi:dihydrofolate reductase
VLSLIVAAAKNGVFGADNKIPWHIPAELKVFKDTTMGHHIVMGRRTWESINRLLPGRETVIVTRQSGYVVPGAVVVNSLEEGLTACGDDDEVFVIGGAELFEAAMPRADRLYFSEVDLLPTGDTYMPSIDWSEWERVSSRIFPGDDRAGVGFRFSIYERCSRST